MKKCIFLSFLISITTLSFGQSDKISALLAIKDNVAPDKRTAIFEISINEGEITVKTDQSSALNVLKGKVDHINLLPAKELAADTFAVVKVPVANIRSAPGHSSELATQALLGTPLRVLEKVGSWYRVQTPDKYIGYTGSSSFTFWNKKEYESQNKVLVTVPYGFLRDKPSKNAEVVSNITWGNLLTKQDQKGKYIKVSFPDGRVGYIHRKDQIGLSALDFAGDLPDGDKLVSSSLQMKGIPYLWGGTSWKGVDCSGFTRTVFLMNGVYLPRDASQQALIGKTVNFNNDFSLIKKGDLLYFGRTENGKQKVTHVAMSLGGAKFIHSSGYVRVNSLNPGDEEYDEYNANRLLSIKRLDKSKGDIHFLNNSTLY